MALAIGVRAELCARISPWKHDPQTVDTEGWGDYSPWGRRGCRPERAGTK